MAFVLELQRQLLKAWGTEEMQIIASLISRAIRTDDEKALAGIKSEVHALTARFPIYTA